MHGNVQWRSLEQNWDQLLLPALEHPLRAGKNISWQACQISHNFHAFIYKTSQISLHIPKFPFKELPTYSSLLFPPIHPLSTSWKEDIGIHAQSTWYRVFNGPKWLSDPEKYNCFIQAYCIINKTLAYLITKQGPGVLIARQH